MDRSAILGFGGVNVNSHRGKPPRLVKRPRVKKADKIAHRVEQHERYMRRDRSSPVWVRVKRAGEEGGDMVGIPLGRCST